MTINVETWKTAREQFMRMMLYGDSGVGKTRFAATWPKSLFLDADKGMMSVDTPVGRINIDSWLELQNAYSFLCTPEAQKQYATIVFDTMNEIHIIYPP